MKVLVSFTRLVIAVSCIMCLSLSDCFSAVIKLKDGRVVEGEITKVNRGVIYFTEKDTNKLKKVNKIKVKSIDGKSIQEYFMTKKKEGRTRRSPSQYASKGKSKLVWGLGLIAAGIASAVYGFSTETETKTVYQVITNPTDITFSNTTTESVTYDGLGRYDTYTQSSSFTNVSGQSVSNVVISVTASSLSNGQGTVYGTETTTIASMSPNSSASYSATVDLSPNSYSFYSYRNVDQYTISSTKDEDKQKSPTIGYVGVGVAAVGTILCIHYFAKQNRQQQALNFEIKPTFYADARGYYQGMTATWHF